jgi:ribonuclease BN (tRNA processing enzyme)
MEVTMLGTGSPVPLVERAGTSLALSSESEIVLVDCGPNTVQRLLESGIDPAAIERLFFTHQHMDHNADFFQFTIGGWSRGRRRLSVYGPPGTHRLVAALESIYDEDIDYRQSIGYPTDGIDDIECHELTPSDTIQTDDITVSLRAVDHSIRTYAYRFDSQRTGESVVFTGDTAYDPGLSDFAADADMLIHDCCMAPPADEPPERAFIWEEFTHTMPEERWDRLATVHANAKEAATVAANADVDTLVLTHLLPYRDHDAISRDARDIFGGTVIVADDRTEVRVPE